MSDLSIPLGRDLARMGIDTKRLIVAIDFGTTYSGVAYCFPGSRDKTLEVISDWPGTPFEVVKIPTVVKYDKGDAKKLQWGALLKSPTDNIVGIKLLLDTTQDLPWYVPRADVKATLRLLPPSKSPKDVAADFLREMKSHAMSQIEKRMTQAVLGSFEIDYVMSVPAVWSDAAKNSTLEAAKAAGITPVTLIKEPEAAALYSIRRFDAFLDPHDVIVICDAGGGTVDLISYEIEQAEPVLQLKEIVPGSGAMVGSIVLNRRFKAAIEKVLPKAKWQELKDSRGMVNASQQFENYIKPGFTGDMNEEHFVCFPGASFEEDQDKGLMGNEWIMTGEDVEDIFEPVIADILGLIQDQVRAVKKKDKVVRAIFLVGGFGSSHYLRKEVERAHKGIRIVQPPDAWAAIAKGAALSRMQDDAVVTSVSAVRHYGVEARHHLFEFESAVDEGERILVGYYTGLPMVRRMKWYIKIGDSIKRRQKIRLGFCRNIPENYTSSNTIFKDTLYECDDKIAPIHRSKSRATKKNCVLFADISSVPTSKFTKRVGARGSPSRAKPYWQVSYDLVISFESAVMTFSMEIDGETLGSVEARFEH